MDERRTSSRLARAEIKAAFFALGVGCALLAACKKPYVAAKTQAKSAPASDFTGPWPDDRLLHNGKLRTQRFPNPYGGGFSDILFQSGDLLISGFGLQSPIYVPFTGPIDPASLPPSPAASLDAHASVRLFETVSGARVPFDWKWYADVTPFLPGNVLAVRPVLGFPLAPKTQYTLLVTTIVRDAQGDAIGPDRATWSAEGAGTAIAVRFTTQPLLDELFVLRDFLQTQPVPVVHDIVLSRAIAHARVFHARYPAPLLLQGDPPYEQSGGDFLYTREGVPVIAATEELRVAVVMPTGPQPDSGFPFVMYSHGTGGNYDLVVDDIGAQLASIGIASVGIDQVLHGTRIAPNATCFGGAPEICAFNPVNAVAGRNLARQSALDHVTLMRALQGLVIEGHTLDTQRFGFFGHSQGGLTGAIYTAIEEHLTAVVLSGTSGNLAHTILERKDPIDLRALAQGPLFLGLDGHDTLDPFHPALALVQTLGDAADPMNYAPVWLANTKNLFLTGGLKDPYAPWFGTLTMAAAGRVPLLLPDATASVAHDLRGIAPVSLPVHADSDGKTAVLRQFPDGDHFVVFADEAQWLAFFATAFADGVATIDHE